ncbi:MAG: thioesterase family protein [Alphaproteobacteria bacterium]|nr:thioesterase family protein [Alphaproteobacteria bacterium]
MRDGLKPGDVHRHAFTVTDAKTVPNLYPESAAFVAMPRVFATGYMVGLMEWACIEALAPHLEEGEGSLGVGIDVTHVAATPPGMVVTVTATCLSVEGRRIRWRVLAEDEVDVIGEGTHDRAVVAWDRFQARLADKENAVAAR